MIVTEMLLVEKTSADFLILLHHSGIQTGEDTLLEITESKDRAQIC